MPIVLPIALLGLGVAALVILATSSEDSPVPVHEPDLSPAPSGSTGYKLVDAILPQLRAASASSGVPLGVIVGWIAKESGGRLGEVTKLDERGLFQLMPAESKQLGLDHARLSTDLVYSINAGLALIGYYMGYVDRLGVASRGTAYFWRLVKLCHTMGSGATKKIVAAAQAAGSAGSWATLEKFALDNNAEMLHETKHSPSKWFPFVDAIAEVGAPFGFGSGDAIVGASGVVPGGKIFDDIVDPLDYLDA
jgi:hypothetical protein